MRGFERSLSWPQFMGLAAALFICAGPASGQAAEAPDGQAQPPANHYVEPRSYGTRRDTDPPRYVRTLSESGVPSLSNLYWLDLGLDQRTRLEYRHNDFRRATNEDDVPVLLRVRAYLAVKEVLDPFRFTLELEDARRYGSQFARDDRDVNEWEPIQAFAELHFKQALGPQSPVRLRAGRMAFEVLDRRFIARNEWRNTTNTFQGFRGTAGSEMDAWQLDLMALQPLLRKLTSLDERNKEQWFFAAIASLRPWSRFITLQPYVFWLRQDGRVSNVERSIQAYALRGYGILGHSGFDYDFNVVLQRGQDDGLLHRAWGLASELGYTFETGWNPRLSGFLGYASGDKDPNDNLNQRFERFFGFARPWSNNDYFQWENIVAPKLRLEATPSKRLRFDAGYSGYFLASATDRWNNAGLRDATGESGTFVGNELDVRLRGKLMPHVDLTFGYAFFSPGEFTRATSRREASHFAYLEASVSLFD